MKIAQIMPGVGKSSVCANCLRDGALLGEFRRLGHEVLPVPLYLPFCPDGENLAADAPLFFGGINVYLQQKTGVFRRTPGFIDRLFDNRKLLEWAGGKFEMKNAKLLGSMTVSILKGRDGYQFKEFDRLIEWLGRAENRPDIVYLSNVLLAGLAGAIRDELGVPVVCLLQDEDKFIDELPLPYNYQVWDILADRVGDIGVFIAVSESYADFMKEQLNIGNDKMHVVSSDYCGDSESGACDVGNLSVEIASVFIMIMGKYCGS